MEDTIALLNNPFNGQVFRITYKTRDFEIKVLKKEINKDLKEIEILLDGFVQKLIKSNGRWTFEHGEDSEFAQDIWRAISLRYRL